MMDSTVDELLDICWSKVANGGDADSIYVTQVLRLIKEIESTLQIPSLFVPAELKLLESLIQSTPRMKVYKREIKEFLVRLVHFPNFEVFLRDRFAISPSDLRIKLRNSGKYTSSYIPAPPPSPPYSPPIKSIPDSKYNNLQHQSVHELRDEIASLKSYISSLEIQLSQKPDKSAKKSLERERVIKNLDKLCRDYQRDLAQSRSRDEQKRNQLNEMINDIQLQDQLISELRNKLDMNESLQRKFTVQGSENEKLKQFLVNLPFLKQYYAYYNYMEETKNAGMVLLNVVALILTAVIVVNVLQAILYAVWGIFGSSKAKVYVYDDYGTSWFGVRNTFEWWKEIEWLEYWVYSIEEWFQGS